MKEDSHATRADAAPHPMAVLQVPSLHAWGTRAPEPRGTQWRGMFGPSPAGLRMLGTQHAAAVPCGSLSLPADHAPNQIAFTQYCVVPIFSFVKERHNEKDYNDDLLVPQLAYPQDGLVYYPEGKQADKAVFRAYRHPASMSSCK